MCGQARRCSVALDVALTTWAEGRREAPAATPTCCSVGRVGAGGTSSPRTARRISEELARRDSGSVRMAKARCGACRVRELSVTARSPVRHLLTPLQRASRAPLLVSAMVSFRTRTTTLSARTDSWFDEYSGGGLSSSILQSPSGSPVALSRHTCAVAISAIAVIRANRMRVCSSSLPLILQMRYAPVARSYLSEASRGCQGLGSVGVR